MVLFAFGVGLHNLAPGRELPPQEMVDRTAGEVPLVASHGSTGNVAFDASR